jgi:hypothetical protein
MTSISVTSIKNWILQDPLLDYLNLYGDPMEKDVYEFEECNFSTFIMNKGNEYEKKVYDYIIEQSNKFKYSLSHINRDSFYQATKQAFKDKSDIILQPFIKNWDTGLFGFPDILIKKSIIKRLFELPFEIDGNEDDYICIDVKYSSCNEKNGMFHIENNYHTFVACQVMLYGQIINKNCKQNTKYAFILPKDTTKLLAVDINNKERAELCDMALNWFQYVKINKEDFDLGVCKPNMVELLPNMNNTMDHPWRGYKTKLAHQYKELSLISGFGNKLRNNFHNKKHYTFEDIISENYNKHLQQKNLIESFCNTSSVVLSNKNINTNNLYIDIETCYIFDQKKEAIVMITAGYNEYNMLHYCTYTGTEEEILKEFKEHIETHFKTYKLVHYGGGESKLFKRLNLTNEVEDLRETFIKTFMNNKNLNNLTGFSIKEIIKSLKINGLIEENPYDECIIKSGIEVLSIYNYIFENRCINAKELLEEQVIKYNKADVKALSVVDYFLLK